MKIIVCLKQVPDTSDVKIDPETHTLIREGIPSIINPFDMYAIEEAIRLKEKFGGKVTALTLGPPQSLKALTEALAMGSDDAGGKFNEPRACPIQTAFKMKGLKVDPCSRRKEF